VTWKAIARYEIGVSHEKQGMPCQDYGKYEISHNVIVGAVADAAGSAKYSDVGAKLVVDSVVSYLSHIAKRIQKRKLCTHSSSQTLSKERAKKLFTKTLSEACAALQQQADSKFNAVVFKHFLEHLVSVCFPAISALRVFIIDPSKYYNLTFLVISKEKSVLLEKFCSEPMFILGA
jgi:Protein phosphatase 2C